MGTNGPSMCWLSNKAGNAKNTRVGPSCWAIPLTQQFCIGNTNMLVSKNAKIWVTPNANAKICVTPNANPQRKQVEYRSYWVLKSKIFGFGHVDFILFVIISFALLTQREPILQWNMSFIWYNDGRDDG